MRNICYSSSRCIWLGLIFSLLLCLNNSVFAQYDIVDNFNRPDGDLGADWAADAEYQIDGNELSNTSTTPSWEFLAVYTAQQNPSQVSFKWGAGVDAAGINEGGLALMLDAPSADASGYLVWRHTSDNDLDIWTIKEGSAGGPIGQTAGLLSAPSAGDEFKVIISTDDNGHHFDCYINGEFDGRVTDPNKLQGNGSSLYAGVMLCGNLNNNIDDFHIFKTDDETPPAAVIDLTVGTITATSVQLTWTAPGDDGNQGTASSYDLRYSTSSITGGNFYSATQVAGTPTPSVAGTPESFTVSGLQPNTTYYFALKTLDDVPYISPISNIPSATTQPRTERTMVDDFNRIDLGADWAADQEFKIDNNELANTSTEPFWHFLAVYNAKTNPSQVSFKWGVNADAAGIDEGGLALMLDAPSADANGYLVWRHASNSKLDIYTIVDGSASQKVGDADGVLSAPSSGDEFEVIISKDASGHHFDCYINGEFDGRVTDPNKLQGNGSTLYAGVMLRGNLNNNIDDFTVSGEPIDDTPPSAVTDLTVGTVTETSIQLTWTAPGDDGNQGTASSYDLRYSTSIITAGNFLNATQVAGTPAPSAAGTPESFTVTGLQENTIYYFALKTMDEANNTSLLSNTPWAITTPPDEQIVDDFNRILLGPDWAADPEYKIVNNELANTSTDPFWDFLAVYKLRINPSQVLFKWGANADAAGINEGGFALRLDAASANADGYLLWRHTSDNDLDIYTIVNGVPVGQSLGQTAGQLSVPTSGDEFKVIISTDENGHHFDCYINGEFDGRVTDPNKLQGNGSTLYAGVMLKGNLNNNIDDFTISGEPIEDDTPPSAVTDLTVVVGAVTETSIQLTWTAPGDDGDQGTATSYDLRYSTSPITEANFLNATQVAGMPKPSAAGTPESFTVKGLYPNTTYYFALKTMDKANNTSLLSNIASGTTSSDVTPPAAVTSLAVASITAISVHLTWTAPGDDGMVGVAASYDLRYSTNLINDLNFDSATQVAGTTTPSEPGQQEHYVIPGLTPNTTYYFALKTIDDAGNTSALSNVVLAPIPPGVETVDDFNRSVLGEDWAADPEYKIVNNELANTSTDPFWHFLAVYNARRNPLGVSFKWGIGADATGIDEGGFALMLDDSSPDANGYLLWRRTTSQSIYLYTIENGTPVSEVTHTSAALPAPQAGDTFSVVMSSDASGHHFDCFLNGQFDGAISDVNKLQGNSSFLYAGVMLKGGLNNNIDDFTLTIIPGGPSRLVITGGDGQDGAGGQPLTNPFEVTVYDENNNPQPGVAVTFSVIWGGGTLDGDVDVVKQVNTDSDGKAQVTLTLGREGETHKVQASAPGLTPVTFTATASSEVAKNMEYVSGDDQSQTVATTLAQPFVVRITDQQGSPMSDITVNYTIIQGSGTPPPSLSQTNPKTDVNGEASSLLTLGTVAGSHKVQAVVQGLNGSPVTFTATAVADAATDLVYESGRDQTGKGGVPLSEPFEVKVTDQYGNDKSGIPVTFSVTAGGGSLSNTLVTTDATGLAATFLTMGTESDTNKVEASSPDLQGSPVKFIAIADSGVVDRIVYVSGSNQRGTVNTNLPEPFKVRVVGKLGQGVPTHKVHFKVLPGGGTLDGASATEKDVSTDSDGIAQVTLTLSANLGVNIVEASSTSRGELLPDSPIIFTATALVPNLEYVSGNGQNELAGMPLDDPFIVKVTDEQGNPIFVQKVTFSVTQGGGTIDGKPSKDVDTAEDGTASVILTLGPIEGQANEVRASAFYDDESLDGSPIIFSATAGEISDLIRVGGNNQFGTAGQPLNNPFKVQVLNNFTVPVSNHPVIFSVSQGGGTFGGSTDTTVQTDSKGFAQAILTLGSTAGDSNKALAKAYRSGFDLNGSPMEFQAISAGIKEIKGVSGNRQVHLVSTPLPLPFKVKIIDDQGKTPKGFPVDFVVTGGGGNFNGDSIFTAYTDKIGFAEATLTLGPLPGTENNVVEARAVYKEESIDGSPITFIASATLGNPTKLVYVSGDSQKGKEGGTLAEKLKVKVTDHAGNLMYNHPVTFTVIAGDGSLDGTGDSTVTKQTDGEGIAEVSWTLGHVAGDSNNVVEATAFFDGNPLEGSPVVFKASARHSPAAVIELVSGTPQEGFAGRTLSQPFRVRVKDVPGNGIEEHPVDFKIIAGGGTLDGDIDTVKTVNTDENGYAEVILTLGKKVGVENIVHAISVNGPDTLEGSPVPFTATSLLDSVDAGVSTIVCVPDTLLADGLSTGLITVTLTDTFGNPVSDKAVIIPSPAGVVQPSNPTNAAGQAFGSITSTKAGVKIISARDVTDGLDLTSTGRVVFLPRPPSELKYVSGGNQTANIGTALQQPLKAQVTDKHSNAIRNYPVYFEVTTGGGRILEPRPIYTDSTGEALATFILGRTTGISNVAEARADTLNGSPVMFMANAVNRPAKNLSLISGRDQSDDAGFALPEPFVVKVTDENDRPVWDHAVLFEVDVGGGNFYGQSSITVRTDYLGLSSAQFVLGQVAGNNSVKAKVGGLYGSPVTFSAQGQIGKAARLHYVQGDSQKVVVKSQLPLPLKVRVTDFPGNGINGYPVIFTVKGDAQLMENQQRTTDGNGYAWINVQLGQTAGAVVVEAQAEELINSPLRFNLTATSDVAASMSLYSGADQSGTVERTLPFPLEVIIKDVHSNPVDDVNVKWVVIDGDGSLVDGQYTTTDQNGIAQNRFVLGANIGLNTAYAIITGLQGSPVIFSVQGVENKFPLFEQVGDKDINEGHLLEFSLSASDDDDDAVTYGVRNLPRGADFDSTGSHQFNWTPDFTQAGDYEVIFLVYDDKGGKGAEYVNIHVNNINRKPHITGHLPGEANLTVYQSEDDTIHFQISAFDPDFEALAYYWTQTSYGESFVVSTRDSYDFAAVDFVSGQHLVTANVSDGIDTDSFQWAVTVNIRTLVELVSFTAEVVKYKGVKLEWQTSQEIHNAGYNILRSLSMDGVYHRINNALIASNREMKYQYIDHSVEVGRTYFYKLEDVDKNGTKIQHEPISISVRAPKKYELAQNYPNPFNSTTKISYQLPRYCHISLNIYNIMGQEVRSLVEDYKAPGYHTSVWDGRDNNGHEVTSGIYFYHIQAKGFVQTKRMILLK